MQTINELMERINKDTYDIQDSNERKKVVNKRILSYINSNLFCAER